MLSSSPEIHKTMHATIQPNFYFVSATLKRELNHCVFFLFAGSIRDGMNFPVDSAREEGHEDVDAALDEDAQLHDEHAVQDNSVMGQYLQGIYERLQAEVTTTPERLVQPVVGGSPANKWLLNMLKVRPQLQYRNNWFFCFGIVCIA